ncbi:MAG TPA: ATP-grasp domain-containing protein [Candidatus Saccharimonadales bacterium]
MANKKNILVFPCGSEIALEIYRSLKYSTHFNLIGGSSINDHGKFIFDDYLGGLPFITDDNFIPVMKGIVEDRNIDAIYPAMDAVIVELKKHEDELGCKIISADLSVVETCLSKSKTYAELDGIIKVPKIFKASEVRYFPVFGKPDVGYGSRGGKKITSVKTLDEFVSSSPESILCEFLPGDEYTVDCFTNKDGELLYFMPRVRQRVMNGISVNTVPYYDDMPEFAEIVRATNQKINFRGAWFLQLKRDSNGKLTLLEIAARLGGSSSLSRGKGVNFAQLTLFDAFGYDVSVVDNDYAIELDRALDTVYKIDIEYEEVFCDFDDCLLIDEKYINTELIAFLYQCINEGKKITLLTKHVNDIDETLYKFRLTGIFDRVIHVNSEDEKPDYVDNVNAIFIDDSFAERAAVRSELGIPVFSVDMVRCLLRQL